MARLPEDMGLVPLKGLLMSPCRGSRSFWEPQATDGPLAQLCPRPWSWSTLGVLQAHPGSGLLSMEAPPVSPRDWYSGDLALCFPTDRLNPRLSSLGDETFQTFRGTSESGGQAHTCVFYRHPLSQSRVKEDEGFVGRPLPHDP